jgi:hypothetical protein
MSYKAGGELGRQDLREMFHVADAEWWVYRRKNGSVGVQPPTKRGERNYRRAVRDGAADLGKVTGVSLKEAAAAAKRIGVGAGTVT